MSLEEKIAVYQQYNNLRKVKTIRFDSSLADIFFKIVPFLLHSNYPDLPGFIDVDQCPCGIHLYDPQENINQALFRKYFPSSSALHTNTPSPFTVVPFIHSLKTIGSIGTIAQSRKSDCDYWLSINHEELGNKGLMLLTEKCNGIVEWALAKNVKLHFFLMDIGQTRENSFESTVDEESAGSAIKILLKDELFRTHIMVAGKMLLWWLVPPGLSDDGYRQYVAAHVQNKTINPDDFVDLGYLSDIPKAEIFGACLWQMNKALDSPFKSVIKFAYLEMLLKKTTRTLPLFSDKVKCLVTFSEKIKQQEQLRLIDVDPYLLLARDLISFYQNNKTDSKRDVLIQECLFLKTLEGIKLQGNGNLGGDRCLHSTMNIMKEWNLLPLNYRHLLQLTEWKYKESIEFGAKVHQYLLATYKELRYIFKNFDNDSALTITSHDISILGRKLFTFYQKKPYKIDYIHSVSRSLMGQDDITVHITRFKGKFYYSAFQRIQNHESVKSQRDLKIRRDDDLIKLIVWLLINGILCDQTTLHLTKNLLPVDLVDIQQLTKILVKTFPVICFSAIAPQKLVQKESVIKALVVVNFNKKVVRGSKTLDSTIISLNSYGEYFIHNYTTLPQLKSAMRDLLIKHYVGRWNNNLEIFIPAQDEEVTIKRMIG